MDNLLTSTTLNMSKVQNIDFLDQTQPTSEVALDNQTTSNIVPISQTITENEWQISDLLTRYILVDTIQWNTTDTRSTSKYTLSYPSGIPNTFPQASILAFMTYVRAGISFKFMVNGTRFHQGRLIASWYPAYRNNVALPAELTNVFYMSCLPHVEIVSDTSESVVLNVPYSQIHSMWSQFEDHDIGYLAVSVLNQLQAATGSSTAINVSLYVKLIDPEVHVPIVPQPPVLKGTRRSTNNILDSGLRDFSKLEIQGGISKTVGGVKKGATAVAKAEAGDYGGAITDGISAIEEVISGVSDIIGGNFDAPNCLHEHTPVIRHIFDNPSAGVGFDASVNLGTYPNNAHVVPKPFLSATQDDMDYRNLISKPCLLRTVNWQGSHTSGTRLDVEAVCPTFMYATNTGTSANLIQPSWMAAIAENYSLWRGTIKFRLEFVGTAFHTGRLAVVFVPFQNAISSVNSLAQAVQSPHVVWDIRDKHEIFIECPYNVTFPHLNLPTMNEWAVERGSYPAGDRLFHSSSGALYIFVLNELAAPGNVVTNADINIWPFAGSDLHFQKQRGQRAFNEIPYTVTIGAPSSLRNLDSLEIQGLTDEKETAETHPEKPDELTNTPPKLAPEQQTHVLQKSETTNLNPSYGFLGEPDFHLKDLLRRFSPIAQKRGILFPTQGVTATSSAAYTLGIPLCLNMEQQGISSSPVAFPVPPPPSSDIRYKHPMTYLQSAFAFWSGKLRFKIKVTPVNSVATGPSNFWTLKVQYMQDSYQGGYESQPLAAGNFSNSLSYGSYPQTWTDVGVQPALDISIPWNQPNSVALTNYTQVDYPLNSQAVSPFGKTEFCEFCNGTLSIEITAGGQNALADLDVLVAFGDDTFLAYPTAPLPLVLNG